MLVKLNEQRYVNPEHIRQIRRVPVENPPGQMQVLGWELVMTDESFIITMNEFIHLTDCIVEN